MDEAAKCVSSIVSKIRFALFQKDEQIEDVINLLVAAAESPGFWSAELLPPGESGDQEWHIVQRFNTQEMLELWLSSASRQRIVADLLSKQATIRNDEVSAGEEQEASTAIVTQVRPGMEKAYFDWVFKIQSVQLKHPGFRGSYLQPPSPGRPGTWAVLLRFDSPESLESWFESPVRKELVAQAEALITAQLEDSYACATGTVSLCGFGKQISKSCT